MSKTRIEKGAVFERYEKKYMLTQTQLSNLLPLLGDTMQMDEYGRHTICTLYYDTEDYAVIRRCLEKPKFKQKLRLRSYGVPGQNSTVYLELKKKLAGVTYKRRVPLAYPEAMAYLRDGEPPANTGQIFREIDWYAGRQPLSGKALISYDRIALFGREDSQLRITFDANIRWRDYAMQLDKGDHGALLLPPGVHLMEIKTLQALPCWLVSLLSSQRVYPTNYSKYGTVYTQYLAGKEMMYRAG